MTIKVGDLVGTGKAVVKEISADDISGLSAELAYRLLLAMFPFFIFVAALGGFVASLGGIDNPAERLVDNVRDTLPGDASSVLEDQLRDILSSKNGALLSIGIIGTIWSASSAVKTFVKALNRAYDVKETRSFLRQNGMAVGLTLLAGTFFVVAFALLIIGQLFASDIGDALGVGSFTTGALNYSRFPLVLLMLVLATAFLYWSAPNTDIPFKWVTPGALVFIVAWVVFTLGFGLYVSNFGSYNSTYGTLGGVVVLMVWLYTSSFIMLVGAEINAVLNAKVQPETMSGPAAAPHEGAVASMRQKVPIDPDAGSAQAKTGHADEERLGPDFTFGTLAIAAAVLALAAVREAPEQEPAGPVPGVRPKQAVRS